MNRLISAALASLLLTASANADPKSWADISCSFALWPLKNGYRFVDARWSDMITETVCKTRNRIVNGYDILLCDNGTNLSFKRIDKSHVIVNDEDFYSTDDPGVCD